MSFYQNFKGGSLKAPRTHVCIKCFLLLLKNVFCLQVSRFCLHHGSVSDRGFGRTNGSSDRLRERKGWFDAHVRKKLFWRKRNCRSTGWSHSLLWILVLFFIITIQHPMLNPILEHFRNIFSLG